MDTEDHQKLVAIIRGMHEKLRRAYLKSDGDYETVWREHLTEHQLRKEYSKAMLKLATEVWNETGSRINWCYNSCIDYFHRGGMQRSIEREKKLLLKELKQKNFKEECVNFIDLNKLPSYTDEKLKLLDVGSCYNPFAKFMEFDCIAIDLTPATEDVYQCDFLQLELLPKRCLYENQPVRSNSIVQLHKDSFHVVVFSLVLEYLPAAKQRLMFCMKAWHLLQENGLLMIITPDSKSLHHNAPMMKSWRTALEKVGFRRVVYEKMTHLHCMAYRKVTIMQPCLENNEELSKFMYIPQDFKQHAEIIIPIERTDEENEDVFNCFCELSVQDDLF